MRSALTDLPRDAPVVAAVSGGADSLALAAALAHERPGSGAAVVDHGLQPGSRAVADAPAAQCAGLGLRVAVGCRWWSPGRGRARPGRRGSARALEGTGATVLLGHTRDDQAETVLLGLARGARGTLSAGMAAVRGRYRRPLLGGPPRALVRRACADAGLVPWEDPHNADPAYARVRVRHAALPALEDALGPGVAAALARSAATLRATPTRSTFYRRRGDRRRRRGRRAARRGAVAGAARPGGARLRPGGHRRPRPGAARPGRALARAGGGGAARGGAGGAQGQAAGRRGGARPRLVSLP